MYRTHYTEKNVILGNNMPWFPFLLLTIQALLLGIFSCFAFFNYLYGISSFWKPRIQRKKTSGQKVAVVIVSFNEEYVLEDTIRACEKLSYSNKLTVLADDSSDPKIIDGLRKFAKLRGCKRVTNHKFFQEIVHKDGSQRQEPIEIWESKSFVFFHRPSNVGFKSGSVQKVLQYLYDLHIEYMYLLDADWHPQEDAIERTMEVLEGDSQAAFVQTKRLSFSTGMNLFQKYISLIEEGCYYIDFEGRQVLGHPILFSGCCTLFRVRAVEQVGGFIPGHLTEDLDLTNRFWLKGWKGIYLGDVINYGEVPFTYDHFRKQQERWSAGSARAFREFFWPVIKSKQLSGLRKLSAVRQNAYFITTLLTGGAILIGFITIFWLTLAWNSYSVEYYLHILESFRIPVVVLLYFCILSNFFEPLIMILFKKRRPLELIHFPMMVWHAWSVLPTHILGNIKGLFNIKLEWFRTPKFNRGDTENLPYTPLSIRIFNSFVCLALLAFYFAEGWTFGWFDVFALLLIPSFILASIK
jgi:cellulose synthase/poly-beta-1,6-N-acetylglucosamine synthase-like glycosyltransferase